MTANCTAGAPEDGVGAGISVVIPVFNNGDTIGKCLDSVVASSCQTHEIIVVDDGSTDNSAAVIREYPCELISLPGNRGVGTARNRGAELATGDLLFFTDGDVSLKADTIATGLDVLRKEPDATAVVGTYARESGAPGFFSTYKNLLHRFTHLNSPRETFALFGACCLIRAERFREFGGFDEQHYRTVLEDIDLGQRLHRAGCRLLLEKSMEVVHHKAYTFTSLLYADLFKRAVPWTRLILRHRKVNLGLCMDTRDLSCLALVWCSLAAAACAFVFPPAFLAVPPACLAVFAVLNRGRLVFFRKERSVAFAAGAALMLCLHYVIGGVGLVAGTISYGSEQVRISRCKSP